jgi:hypothetical protein
MMQYKNRKNADEAHRELEKWVLGMEPFLISDLPRNPATTNRGPVAGCL